MSHLVGNWANWAQNSTNIILFHICFPFVFARLKRSQICPTCCKFGPFGGNIWHLCRPQTVCLHIRDGRFGSKVGQIGPKWDQSGAFSDQISVHLAPRICPIWGQSDPLWSQTYHPCTERQDLRSGKVPSHWIVKGSKRVQYLSNVLRFLTKVTISWGKTNSTRFDDVRR